MLNPPLIKIITRNGIKFLAGKHGNDCFISAIPYINPVNMYYIHYNYVRNIFSVGKELEYPLIQTEDIPEFHGENILVLLKELNLEK